MQIDNSVDSVYFSDTDYQINNELKISRRTVEFDDSVTETFSKVSSAPEIDLNEKEVIKKFPISIFTEPINAKIYIDSIYKGLSNKTIYLPFGYHEIRLLLDSVVYEDIIEIPRQTIFTYEY